jgi:hypothetical protein
MVLESIAVVVLAAAPGTPEASARAPAKSAVKVPIGVDAPKLEIKLAPLPLVEGLSGPARESGLQAREAPSDQREPTRLEGAKIASVIHAKDFAKVEGGYRPVSPIESFVVPSVPARIAPFKTCVRLTSSERLPVVVRASLRSPSGDELLSSRAEVAFGARDSMELLVDWDGFQALRVGEYNLLVSLDGGLPAQYSLSVQQAK